MGQGDVVLTSLTSTSKHFGRRSGRSGGLQDVPLGCYVQYRQLARHTQDDDGCSQDELLFQRYAFEKPHKGNTVIRCRKVLLKEI